MEKEIEGVEIVGVVVKFDGKVSNSDLEEGFGAIRLNCEGRSFILDVTASDWSFEDGETIVDLELEVDTNVFDEDESKYDLTSDDLLSNNLISTIFIGDVRDILNSATLFVEIGSMVKAIDLILE